MDGKDILNRQRRQRHDTLALADQIQEDRWREPALPGANTIHDVLAHLLAWDEWAAGVFELSWLRDAVPPTLQAPLDDLDAFNARAQARYRNISRDDMLSALQSVSDIIVRASLAHGGDAFAERQLNGLTTKIPGRNGQPDRTATPTIGAVLHTLTKHEALHAQEISDAFGVTVPTGDGEANADTQSS